MIIEAHFLNVKFRLVISYAQTHAQLKTLNDEPLWSHIYSSRLQIMTSFGATISTVFRFLPTNQSSVSELSQLFLQARQLFYI